jgi:putative flippase GtrA
MTTTSPLPMMPVPVAACGVPLRPSPAAVPGRATMPTGRHHQDVPVLDVVVPVYNEEADLATCVTRLRAYLSDHFPYGFRITVADNASTDRTWQIARSLADRLPDVAAVHLDAKGRGRALRQVWQASDALVLAYLDVDLSTDLAALLPLVAPLISGHSDLAIGSRLARGSRVVRGPKREFISRSYNFILRAGLAARFSDAQCGFKAIRGDVARRLMPMVKDTGWFFDTEMLVLAERAGLRIHEVPVDWVDDPDSRVDIVSTAIEDLKGVVRVGRTLARGELPLHTLLDETRTARPTHGTTKASVNGSVGGATVGGAPVGGAGVGGAPVGGAPVGGAPVGGAGVGGAPVGGAPVGGAPVGGAGVGGAPVGGAPVGIRSGGLAAQGVPAGLPWQLLSFTSIGVASTVAYAVLFWLLRSGFGAQTANLVALLLTAIANTATNRRLTFGVSGRVGAARHQLQGLFVFALGLGVTSGSLAVLHAVSPSPRRGIELSVLVLASLVATVIRFLLMRVWIFRRHRHHSR